MKRLILALTMLVGLEVCAGPYIPIKCNFEDQRNNQFNIQTAVANTPEIKATLYQGTNLMTNTSAYTAVFRFSQSERSSSMTSITGTISGSVASFFMLPTTFMKSFDRWYAAVVLQDTLHAQYYSMAKGMISVRAAPEFTAPGWAYTNLSVLNGSLFGTFIGNFTNWPFVLKNSYLGGYIQAQEYYDTQTYWHVVWNQLFTQKVDKTEFYEWTNKIAVSYTHATNDTNDYVILSDYSYTTGDLYRVIGSNLVYLGGVSGRVAILEQSTNAWSSTATNVAILSTQKLDKVTWYVSTASRILDSDTNLWNQVQYKLNYSVWTQSPADDLTFLHLTNIDKATSWIATNDLDEKIADHQAIFDGQTQLWDSVTSKLGYVEFYTWTNKIHTAYTAAVAIAGDSVSQADFDVATNQLFGEINTNLVSLGNVSNRVVSLEGRTNTWNSAYTNGLIMWTGKLDKTSWFASTASRIVDDDTSLWNTVQYKMNYRTWTESIASVLVPQDLTNLNKLVSWKNTNTYDQQFAAINDNTSTWGLVTGMLTKVDWTNSAAYKITADDYIDITNDAYWIEGIGTRTTDWDSAWAWVDNIGLRTTKWDFAWAWVDGIGIRTTRWDSAWAWVNNIGLRTQIWDSVTNKLNTSVWTSAPAFNINAANYTSITAMPTIVNSGLTNRFTKNESDNRYLQSLPTVFEQLTIYERSSATNELVNNGSFTNNFATGWTQGGLTWLNNRAESTTEGALTQTVAVAAGDVMKVSLTKLTTASSVTCTVGGVSWSIADYEVGTLTNVMSMKSSGKLTVQLGALQAVDNISVKRFTNGNIYVAGDVYVGGSIVGNVTLIESDPHANTNAMARLMRAGDSGAYLIATQYLSTPMLYVREETGTNIFTNSTFATGNGWKHGTWMNHNASLFQMTMSSGHDDYLTQSNSMTVPNGTYFRVRISGFDGNPLKGSWVWRGFGVTNTTYDFYGFATDGTCSPTASVNSGSSGFTLYLDNYYLDIITNGYLYVAKDAVIGGNLLAKNVPNSFVPSNSTFNYIDGSPTNGVVRYCVTNGGTGGGITFIPNGTIRITNRLTVASDSTDGGELIPNGDFALGNLDWTNKNFIFTSSKSTLQLGLDGHLITSNNVLIKKGEYARLKYDLSGNANSTIYFELGGVRIATNVYVGVAGTWTQDFACVNVGKFCVTSSIVGGGGEALAVDSITMRKFLVGSLAVAGSIDAGGNISGANVYGDNITAISNSLTSGLGVSLNRWVDLGDGTVEDMASGLMWSKNADHQGPISWYNAVSYVAGLNATQYLGYSDWRLPEVNESILGRKGLPELESLFHIGGISTNPYVLPGSPFLGVNSDYYGGGYWSSLSNSSASGYAFAFSFYTGVPYGTQHVGSIPIPPTVPSANLRVWPVRRSLPITKTDVAMVSKNIDMNGMTISNGSYSGNGFGITNLVIPRYVDNQNGTISDTLTGLMWPKDVQCIPSSPDYAGVPALLASINDAHFLGYSDWRIPSVQQRATNGIMGMPEWDTLGRIGGITTNLWSFNYESPFTNWGVAYMPYWTSVSSPPGLTPRHYIIWPMTGSVGDSGDGSTVRILPVRSGKMITDSDVSMVRRNIDLNNNSITNGSYSGNGAGITNLHRGFLAQPHPTFNQSIGAAAWTKLWFSNVIWNVGTRYNPVLARYTGEVGRIRFEAAVGYGDVGGGGDVVGLRLYKNQIPYREMGFSKNSDGGYPNQLNSTVTIDNPQETNQYEIWTYCSQAVNTLGNVTSMWFSAEMMQ